MISPITKKGGMEWKGDERGPGRDLWTLELVNGAVYVLYTEDSLCGPFEKNIELSTVTPNTSPYAPGHPPHFKGAQTPEHVLRCSLHPKPWTLNPDP